MKYKVNCALVYYVPRMRPMRQFGSLWAPAISTPTLSLIIATHCTDKSWSQPFISSIS